MYCIACIGDRYLFYGYGWLSYPNTKWILFLASLLQELGHFLTKLSKLQNSIKIDNWCFIVSITYETLSNARELFFFFWPQTNIFSSVLCLGNCDQNKECSWNSIAMTLILMTFFCPLILKTSRISFTRIRSTFNMRLCDMEIWVVKFPRDEYKIRQIVG